MTPTNEDDFQRLCHAEVEVQLGAWLDQASAEAPDDIVAFCINLNESPFNAELVGSTYYDDEDWACEEAFVPTKRQFDLPHSLFGAGWEQALANVMEMVDRHLDHPRSGRRLKRAIAVSIGFVDGELVRMWPRSADTE